MPNLPMFDAHPRGWQDPVILRASAALAAAGSSQISYFTARAASLNLDFKRPEYAGKGSRTTVVIICGLLAPLWIHFPLVALLYLALHPNLALLISMVRLMKSH